MPFRDGGFFDNTEGVLDSQQQQQQQRQQGLFDMLGGVAGGDLGSLIAKPPEGWQSQSQIYNDAGFGNGWLYNNDMENRDAYAHTKAGPQMPYGIDPFTDIDYGGSEGSQLGQEGQTSGFWLKDRRDPTSRIDLFGGRQFHAGNLPRDIPAELQPWLAPSLMKFFNAQGYTGQGGSGVNAPWTGRYAPVAPKLEHPTHPGIARYDPWHRDLGAYPNLYS